MPPASLLPVRLACATLATLLAAASWPVSEARAAWPPNGTPICTTPEQQSSLTMVGDGNGGVIVAWSDGRLVASIYAQRVDSNGVALWAPDGRLVNTSVRAPRNPVAQAFLGGAVIVWAESPTLDDIDLVGQRIDLAGNLLWAADGVPIATSPDRDESPVLVGNGSSGTVDPVGFYVAWARSSASGSYGERTIVVKAVNSVGEPIWASGELLLSSPPDTPRGLPVLALDGTGQLGRARGVVVAWEEMGSFTSMDIAARRVTASGTRPWVFPAGNVCDEAYGQSQPCIAQVGTNTVIAWSDSRSYTSSDLYAQRLSSSGGAYWTASGLAVCTATGSQFGPRTVADNAGGTIIAWIDTRSGSHRPFAQRLDANGQRLWATDGVELCAQATGLNELAMVGDGAGGAIVAWADQRNGGFDLYAQRVSASGELVWLAGGVPLCVAAGNQYGLRLVRDSGAGALAAWIDPRNGALADVYATRAHGASGLVDVPRVPVSRAGLALESANPSNGPVRLRLVLAEPATVSVEVLDVAGRRVRTLHAESPRGAGAHALWWDGADDAGRRAPSGVYLVRARAGERTFTARVVAVR